MTYASFSSLLKVRHSRRTDGLRHEYVDIRKLRFRRVSYPMRNTKITRQMMSRKYLQAALDAQLGGVVSSSFFSSVSEGMSLYLGSIIFEMNTAKSFKSTLSAL